MSRDSINLDRLADVFRARIHELIREWKLQGHRDGNDFVALNPLRNDEHLGTFRVGLAGKYQGMVTDFAGEVIPGDGRKSVSALTFHIHRCHGGDKGAAVAWGKDWAGFTDRAPEALQVSKQALAAFDERPQESAEDVAKKRKRAHRIYLDKTVPWQGTPAQEYYTGRGIDLTSLPFVPGAPRFKEKCFCGSLGKPGNDPAAYLPAIILPFVSMTGEFWAVHRTYLAQVDGAWVQHPELKARKLAKSTYAPMAGGVIHLWAGSRVLKRTGEIAYGQSLSKAAGPLRVHITEGPEDGWSVALAYPDERVDVAGSVSNMGGLAYPEKVTEIVIWKQNDAPGSPADRAFRQAVVNFKAQGKKVMVADVTDVAPWAKDAADVLKGKA